MSALSRGGAYPIARLVELATRYAADHDHGAMAGSPTPDATGIDQEEWGRALWALVWRGSVTNSSFAPVRMRASMVEPSRASGPGVHGGGYGAGGTEPGPTVVDGCVGQAVPAVIGRTASRGPSVAGMAIWAGCGR